MIGKRTRRLDVARNGDQLQIADRRASPPHGARDFNADAAGPQLAAEGFSELLGTGQGHSGLRGAHDAIASFTARAIARPIGRGTPLPIALRLPSAVIGQSSSKSAGKPCSSSIRPML